MAAKPDKDFVAGALREELAAVLALREQGQRMAMLAPLKTWQASRLAKTYADLLTMDRYRPATRFFLDDLYGPTDFRGRDEQLGRVLPVMCSMLPVAAIQTIGAAVRLDRLSESLDQDVARALPQGPVDAVRYAQAYRAAGRAAERELQIALTLEICVAVDGLTKKRSLRMALALMRQPARAAGFGVLQDFLERGFEASRHMGEAAEFLAIVGGREREVMKRLFDTHPDPFGTAAPV